jgi:hypothetical protein
MDYLYLWDKFKILFEVEYNIIPGWIPRLNQSSKEI